MEDFLRPFLTIMKLKHEIYNELKEYSNQYPLEEVCGFIVEKDNLITFIKIDNKHPQKDSNILISPKDYLSIKNNYNILYYFHSHPFGSDFSETDLFYQKFHNLNMLIYNISKDMFKEKKCKII